MRLSPFPWQVGLAPLAGYNEPAFRMLCRQYGAQWTMQGLVSAEGLSRGGSKSERLLRFFPQERPIFAQLFGASPFAMAAAAQQVEAMGFDGLDLNFGCPEKKILRVGAGAALMADLNKAEAVVGAVRRSVKLMLTMKIRLGWENQRTFLQFGRMAEDLGLDAVILHPRTVAQGFSGQADWDAVGQLKHAMDIPVVASGDVRDGESYRQLITRTGCDSVLIGRSALRRPWVFEESLACGRGEAFQPPALPEVVLRYLALLEETESEEDRFPAARLHLLQFLHDLPHAAALRAKVGACHRWSALKDLMETQFSRLEAS
ncbi:MAG: tRNA-dihydrouridine synthase family protein [Coprothermobacterota bacterium]|nr:tRNA-dihydrouridine synthase family protein [Coprothermobacterota bacterium]